MVTLSMMQMTAKKKLRIKENENKTTFDRRRTTISKTLYEILCEKKIIFLNVSHQQHRSSSSHRNFFRFISSLNCSESDKCYDENIQQRESTIIFSHCHLCIWAYGWMKWCGIDGLDGWAYYI